MSTHNPDNSIKSMGYEWTKKRGVDKWFVHSFFPITLISGQSGQGVDKLKMLKNVIKSVGSDMSGQSGQRVDKLFVSETS